MSDNQPYAPATQSPAEPVEYRVEEHAAKLGGRHRSSVVEFSIRKPRRPASTDAGRRIFNELRDAIDCLRRPATPRLAPPLAPLGRAGATQGGDDTRRIPGGHALEGCDRAEGRRRDTGQGRGRRRGTRRGP